MHHSDNVTLTLPLREGNFKDLITRILRESSAIQPPFLSKLVIKSIIINSYPDNASSFVRYKRFVLLFVVTQFYLLFIGKNVESPDHQ